MIKGIDISHHQHDKGRVDLALAKASGYDFCFIKASQGTSYVDKFFTSNRDAARAAGMVVGFYHFAGNFNGKTSVPGDPIAEADWMLKCIGTVADGDVLILDWEVDQADPDGWCYAFCRRVLEATGTLPIFYTYEARLKKHRFQKVKGLGCPLWIAKYGDNDQEPEPHEEPQVAPWDEYLIWQYSSGGSVPGIVGRVDCNILKGTMGSLKKYGHNPLSQSPMPTPVPQRYFRYGHANELFVKVGDRVKKSQKIGTIGKGGPNNFSAHVHFDILLEKLKDWTSYVIGKSREWVAAHHPDPEPWKKIVLPTFTHEGLGYLQFWKYPNGPAYHPGDDLNSGGGDSDLGHPFYSACDGVVVYAYDGPASNNGWGKLLVIEETNNQPNPEIPMDGKSKVLPELRDALQFAHDVNIGEHIDDEDQRLMANRLTELKRSELAAREKVEKVREVVK